jgi:hypothetical protein
MSTNKDTGKEAAAVAPDAPNAPATDGKQESPRASTRVKTVWPIGSFDVEGVPTITLDGTMLTKTQLQQVEKTAEVQSGDVALEVEDVN